ncbi:MAG: polysaccharide deacetylase family protein [Bacteroidetes bacterium]|nr:polysaccharide deacetylase family protein [Bacteroidota bacterium]MDA0903591.1 polysaccharide deacetylase family protein [Bacteroidota bacterium]
MNRRTSSIVWPAHIPRWIHPTFQLLWPGTLWSVTDSPHVHLTFDDGPHPDITPWVLDCLKDHEAKATFFVVGQQIARQPDVVRRIVAEGHGLGAHSMSHENGWKTSNDHYVHSATMSRSLVQEFLSPRMAERGVMFRPPYGKLTRRQAQALAPHGPIVMWDVLGGDYAGSHAERGWHQVLHRVKRHTRPGSLVVLHDSPKCAHVVKRVLPSYLSWLHEQGWNSRALSPKQY